jgi:[acyl-carrier-protein] S-malonyltransferase
MRGSALIFPGQGAQAVGMAKDFYDSYLLAREVFEEADEILERSLSRIIFTGPSELLDSTKNSQPALFVVSMAILKVLQKELPEIKVSFCGGLSLGEYSALCAAGIIDFKEALELVSIRGALMEKAAEKYPGGMTAVFGLTEEVIKEAGIWVANNNSPGQVVVAYPKKELEKVHQKLQELGAKRLIPLRVSGAFHSPLMREAEEALAPIIHATSFQKGSAKLVMNCNGGFVEETEDRKEMLIRQVSSTTRWIDCVETLNAKEPDHFIEIGPTQLTAMLRKMGFSTPLLSVSKVADLEGVYETIRK